jgi:hypothetical protein
MNKQYLSTKKIKTDDLFGKPDEKSLNVWIPADLKEELDVYCNREDQKIRKVAADAIRLFLKKKKRQAKK